MPAATQSTAASSWKKCSFCRKPFQARRSNARFCCQPCRQKAARRAKGGDPKTAARRRHKTKKATPLEKVCLQCERPFVTTAAAAKKQFCTPACRAAAYRQRKAVAVAALCMVATAQGYSAERVRGHVASWSLQRLATAIDRATPKVDIDWVLVTAAAQPASPA